MDELVTVLVAVFGSLGLITVILVAIICGVLKKEKKESVKQEIKILDSNHNISVMDNDVKIANNKNEENIICQDIDDDGDGVVMAYTNEGDNPSESNDIQAVNKTHGCSESGSIDVDIINVGEIRYTNEGSDSEHNHGTRSKDHGTIAR
eukprot:3468_1